MSVKSKEIWQPLYPFESHFLDLGGYRMHYVDEQKGQKSGGASRETLLMVHGNPTWSFFFRNLITAFRNRYRTIAVDHVGCGLSDKPNESEYTFRLEQRITDLCRLIESQNLQKITLIAHDWGGAIGMGAATRLPDRFDRIVLMNTAAFHSTNFPLRIRVCRTPIFGRLAIQGLNLFARAALIMATDNRKNLSKEVRSGLLAPYNNWNNRIAIYRFVDDIPASANHPSFKTLKEIERKLPQLRNKPVALIWGMRDWCFTPEFLKRFLQDFPEAEVHRIENAGHYLLEDAGDTVLDAITGFLEKNALPR